MEVEYKKDLKHNYMVIANENHQKMENYCIKLLEYQTLEGLLLITLKRMDNKLLFYYEITAKQSMSSLLERGSINNNKLIKLIRGILLTLEKAYEYLLPEEDFVLQPEFIYMDIVTYEPRLCYFPGYGRNIREQLNSIIEYLMNKVEYNDKEAVLLIYRLYAVIKEDGFSFDHLFKVLQGNDLYNSDEDFDRQSDKESGKRSYREADKHDDKEAGKQGSKEAGNQGYKDAVRQGNKEAVRLSSNKTISDEIESDETVKGKTVKDKITRGKTTREKTTRDITARDETVRNITTRDKTAKDITVRDITVRDITGRDITGRDKTVRDIAARDITTRDITARGITVRDKTAKDKKAKGKTARDITARDKIIRDKAARVKGIRDKIIRNKETTNIENNKDSLTNQMNYYKASAKNAINNHDILVMKEKVEGEAEVSCYPIITYFFAAGCILGGLLIIVLCISMRFLYNSFGNQIDFSKLFALVLIIVCVEGYCWHKIFDKKNKITRIVKTCDYIDPILEGNPTGSPFDSIGNKINIRLSHFNNTINREDDKAALNMKEQDPFVTMPGIQENQDRLYNIPQHAAEKELIPRKFSLHKEETDCEDDINPTCILNVATEQKSVILLRAQDSSNYKDITISSFPFFIGKLKKNVDYCLEKDVISRFHAKVTKEGEQFFLTDLNSTNGTYINQEPLQTYQKKEIIFGDEITFANIIYQFVEM